MQTITTIGLDIAKSVFQVHGVDAAGQVVIRRQLKRRHVLAFFEKLPPCLVGIEACASSHHWSRELQALSHTVRLMPPAYVKPYVKRQKNDMADAEAICEAVTRANMRFVPTKTPEQQSCLMLHRTRKPKDFDAELKALGDKARELKSRKVQRLGELVVATGADALNANELAGALIVLAETKEAGKREGWAKRGAAFFQSRSRRTAPAAERHTGGARAQPGGAQPSTGGKGAA
jgi:hypothetical protein